MDTKNDEAVNANANPSAEAQRRQALSDLADGHANAQQVELLLADWERDESLRREWQTLHLIGAALRSPELASPAQSGEALLAGLRERIAHEPVLLRPRRLSQWLPALGVAASFVMIALLLPSLPLHTTQNQLAIAPVTPDPNLANALVEAPASRTLDGTPSFVQAIVAPEQPGLVVEPQPRARLLRADANPGANPGANPEASSGPNPLAHAASANSP
ncbi:MAG TPA: sigma-E factor negative regulatory protein [Burkholderiaceae bacterium]